jgi:hypothetical protein
VSVLNAVAAVPFYSGRPSHNTMWAVGYTSRQVIGAPEIATLTLYYNGRAWQVVPSPNVAAENVLTGVAAYSENEVWAVGHSYNGYEYDPLLMRFDGVTWTPVEVAIPEPDLVSPWDVRLTGITILSDYGESLNPPQPGVAAVAVGYIEHLNGSRPIALYYDGSDWKLMPLPPAMLNGRFYAVGGTSLTDLWAVGTLYEEGRQVAYLFHHSADDPADGWTPIVKGDGVLTALAITADRVFTVGHVETMLGVETLVMAYTKGTGDWAKIQSFNTPVGENVLTAVTSTGPAVYAVGYTTDGTNDVARDTLVLAYDGSEFVPVASPNPGLVNELNGAAVTRGVLWTVGTTGKGLQRATLVLNNNCVTDC